MSTDPQLDPDEGREPDTGGLDDPVDEMMRESEAPDDVDDLDDGDVDNVGGEAPSG